MSVSDDLLKLDGGAKRKDVIMTVANWTDEEKHVAVDQIARLAGLPTDLAARFADEVAPKPPRRKH
jgi:hypothetical protein